ncbi:unnamed protein product [Calicophoron daubneyi]|uniref:Uncharacterized protein n=1 Tax=Calicophoron daubneyi TaxID=300641 RepID=A0AAV2TW77_CALDB
MDLNERKALIRDIDEMISCLLQHIRTQKEAYSKQLDRKLPGTKQNSAKITNSSAASLSNHSPNGSSVSSIAPRATYSRRQILTDHSNTTAPKQEPISSTPLSEAALAKTTLASNPGPNHAPSISGYTGTTVHHSPTPNLLTNVALVSRSTPQDSEVWSKVTASKKAPSFSLETSASCSCGCRWSYPSCSSVASARSSGYTSCCSCGNHRTQSTQTSEEIPSQRPT